MGASKNVKEPNEKKVLGFYQRKRVQKLGSPKNERAEKNQTNYIKWKL